MFEERMVVEAAEKSDPDRLVRVRFLARHAGGRGGPGLSQYCCRYPVAVLECLAEKLLSDQCQVRFPKERAEARAYPWHLVEQAADRSLRDLFEVVIEIAGCALAQPDRLFLNPNFLRGGAPDQDQAVCPGEILGRGIHGGRDAKFASIRCGQMFENFLDSENG